MRLIWNFDKNIIKPSNDVCALPCESTAIRRLHTRFELIWGIAKVESETSTIVDGVPLPPHDLDRYHIDRCIGWAYLQIWMS